MDLPLLGGQCLSVQLPLLTSLPTSALPAAVAAGLGQYAVLAVLGRPEGEAAAGEAAAAEEGDGAAADGRGGGHGAAESVLASELPAGMAADGAGEADAQSCAGGDAAGDAASHGGPPAAPGTPAGGAAPDLLIASPIKVAMALAEELDGSGLPVGMLPQAIGQVEPEASVRKAVLGLLGGRAGGGRQAAWDVEPSLSRTGACMPAVMPEVQLWAFRKHAAGVCCHIWCIKTETGVLCTEARLCAPHAPALAAGRCLGTATASRRCGRRCRSCGRSGSCCCWGSPSWWWRPARVRRRAAASRSARLWHLPWSSVSWECLPPSRRWPAAFWLAPSSWPEPRSNLCAFRALSRRPCRRVLRRRGGAAVPAGALPVQPGLAAVLHHS